MGEAHVSGVSCGLLLAAVGVFLFLASSAAAGDGAAVCNIKVTSDKVEDVSSIEAWKAAVLRPGMTDEEKAIAIWEMVVKFRHQNSPPWEYLTRDGEDFCVHDVIKTANVYGYGMCCCASANITSLARSAGLPTRGRALHGHSLPEILYDGKWHMFDASLINYFRGADGGIAGIDEMLKSVAAWDAANPGHLGDTDKLRAFAQNEGWRKGPAVFASSEFFSRNGWLPAGTHGWHGIMKVFDGTVNDPYEFPYSQGYRVNIILRPGETLTRNWSHKGLHIDLAKNPPYMSALTDRIGEGELGYADDFGDIAPGRIGNGSTVWEVPLSDPRLAQCALEYDNLQRSPEGAPALSAASADRPGVLVLDMRSSYVCLGGKMETVFDIAEGGSIKVLLSRNNGMDWKLIHSTDSPGGTAWTLDLKPLVHRLYDYRLRFEFTGKGTGLSKLRIEHDIQQSQRALPALAQGENTIAFSAEDADEATVTIEGLVRSEGMENQLGILEYHPVLDGVECTANGFELKKDGGTVTFALETPGDMRRLRFGSSAVVKSEEGGWDYLVSFDDGATWKKAGALGGIPPGFSEYVTFADVPQAARRALVRFAGRKADGGAIIVLRIDADYALPGAGFFPVKITYAWEENGKAKTDVHVATSAAESYKITCAEKPVMKSLVVELAGQGE